MKIEKCKHLNLEKLSERFSYYGEIELITTEYRCKDCEDVISKQATSDIQIINSKKKL